MFQLLEDYDHIDRPSLHVRAKNWNDLRKGRRLFVYRRARWHASLLDREPKSWLRSRHCHAGVAERL